MESVGRRYLCRRIVEVEKKRITGLIIEKQNYAYPLFRQGRVQKVLNEMARLGYIEREKKGAKSKAILTNHQRLLDDRINAYRFEYNEIYSYYSSYKDTFRRLKGYFKGKEEKYALTRNASVIGYAVGHCEPHPIKRDGTKP